MNKKEDLSNELEERLLSKEQTYIKRGEIFKKDKIILNDYLIESNIERKLEDIVQWARNKGLRAGNKKISNLISENVMRDETIGDSDIYQFVFSVKQKKFIVQDYYHVLVRAFVTGEHFVKYNSAHTEVKDSEHHRRVLWSYEGGSEEEYSGVMTGGMGMEEEKMLVLFKKVLVDLVENL